MTYLLGYREGGQEEMLDYIECLGEDLQGPFGCDSSKLGQEGGAAAQLRGGGYCGVKSHVACHMLAGTLIRSVLRSISD